MNKLTVLLHMLCMCLLTTNAQVASGGGGGGGGATTPTTPTFTGLVVETPVQPNPTLAPLYAVRIPDLRMTFRAVNANVDVDGLVIQRGGKSVDDVIDGVVLLDENGVQMGGAGYLNSAHQATIQSRFTVTNGAPRTLGIAFNRPRTSNAAHAGMTVDLSLVTVLTKSTVTGIFPIVGTTHTVNEGLVIGSVTASRGLKDPGTSMAVTVGTERYTFSSIRLTAGSAEGCGAYAIVWTQTGTAIESDLKNVVTVVDGVAYPTIVNGNRYLSLIAASGSIQSGFSKEFSIQGDLVSGAGRTADFDIVSRGDVYLVGTTFGYGILPPLGAVSPIPDTSDFTMHEDPWYDASEVTITSGSITIAPSELAQSRNISVNAWGQILGGFKSIVVGEPVTARRLGFNVDLGQEGASDDVDDYTNVEIVDESGRVVAGPIDGSAADSVYTAGAKDGSLVFTDAVTFPVGTHHYFVRGRAGTDLDFNSTVQLSITPSTDFAFVRGTVTDKQVTAAPASAITMAKMTVRGPYLKVSIKSLTLTNIAGARLALMGKMSLDATASSEDIRLVYGTTRLTSENGAVANKIHNLSFYDGSTPVTTGANLVQPQEDGYQKSTFDGTGIIITRGTVKTVRFYADISANATGTYTWSLPDIGGTWVFLATGVESAMVVSVDLGGGESKVHISLGGTVTIRKRADASVSEDAPHRLLTTAIETSVERFYGGQVLYSINVSPVSALGIQRSGDAIAAELIPTLRVNGKTYVGAMIPGKGYFASFDLRQEVLGTSTEAVLEVADSPLLRTGDKITARLHYLSPMSGYDSGFRVEPSIGDISHTITIRRIPKGAVGDIDNDGGIDIDDLQELRLYRNNGYPDDADLIRRMNCFPDRVIDEFDEAALDAYLRGLFFTLPAGDVNFDWKLSTTDIALTRHGILGMRILENIQRMHADMNGNGTVTTLDIVLIRRLILGLNLRPLPFYIVGVPLTSAERTLAPGTTGAKVLYKFKVTAPLDATARLDEFALSLATAAESSIIVDGFSLHAFTDAGFSQPDSFFSPTGLLNADHQVTVFAPVKGAMSVQVPVRGPGGKIVYEILPGQTRYFALYGTVRDVEADVNRIDTLVVQLFTVGGERSTSAPEILVSQ